MSDTRKPWRENVAEEMIRQIEAGTAPWQKPWKAGVGAQAPHNPTSEKPYRGINALWLGMQGYDDPRWLTYRQATSLGAQVRKAEKASQVEYWKWSENRPVLDGNGKPVMGDDGKPKTQSCQLDRPQVFYANVFNATQIDGLEPYMAPEPTFEPVEEAERLLTAGGITIRHDQGDRACYSATKDQIHLPDKAAFDTAYAYYATALHELGHATGHRSRLARDFGPFGTEVYAREELRAEMASYQISRELGLGHYPERHAAYVKSWLKAIREDRNVLFQAARDAEQITSWVREPELRPALERKAQANRKGEVMSAEHEQGRESLEENRVKSLEHELGREWLEEDRAYERHFMRERENRAKSLEHEQDVTRETVVRYEIWPGKNGVGFDLMGFNEGDEIRTEDAFENFKEAQAADREFMRKLQVQAKSAEHEQGSAASIDKAQTNIERRYIAVPFAEKDRARAQGARWDRQQKSWYVPKGVDQAAFKEWLLTTEQKNQLSHDRKEHDPVAEFTDELKAAGVSLKEAPLMDGKWHRVSLEDDKDGQKNASYRAFLDGRPNGHIQNFRSGDLILWVSRGENLSEEQRASLKAEAAQRQTERLATRRAAQGAAEAAAKEKWHKAEAVMDTTPYLDSKQVDNFGLKKDGRDNTLVPMCDTEGKLRSLQTIAADGTKRFEKGGRKTGLMYVIDAASTEVSGSPAASGKLSSQTRTVFIAESYGTAATVYNAVHQPTVVAFDSGNLKPVAEAIHQKYPTATIVIAADNDHKLENKPIGNVGLNKALDAARAVGGTVIAPEFDDNQKASGLSDWNDLANDKSTTVVSKQIRKQLKQQRSIDKPRAASQGM